MEKWRFQIGGGRKGFFLERVIARDRFILFELKDICFYAIFLASHSLSHLEAISKDRELLILFAHPMHVDRQRWKGAWGRKMIDL